MTALRDLTERRKADRAVMAKQVAELARSHGLSAAVVPEHPGTRETRVVLAGPHTLALTVWFRGNSPQSEPDTYVLSWHMRPWMDEGKGRALAPGFADIRLGTDGHKATDVARGFDRLHYLLARRFAAIADGSAFVPELPYRHTAEDYGRVSPRVAAAEVREPNRPGWRP